MNKVLGRRKKGLIRYSLFIIPLFIILYSSFTILYSFDDTNIERNDPVFTREIVSYSIYGEGEDALVKYQYVAEPLPELLAPNEVPELRNESSYTKHLGTNEKGEDVYELIAYSDKAYVEREGQWFARETGSTNYKTFALLRRANPIASLFWERAYADSIAPFAEVGDGHVGRDSSTTWATVRDATAGIYPDYTLTTFFVDAGRDADLFYEVYRGFLPFNTSALSTNATISAATLNVYTTAKTNGDNDGQDYITVIRTSQTTHTSLALSDYDNVVTTEGIDSGQRKDITSITTSAYMTFTLNATGLSWIAKSGTASNCSATTGITCLGLREGHDNENAAPTGISKVTLSASEETGTAQDPYLSVTYTLTTGAFSKPPNNLGLVGYWPMNEATSTKAGDFSGNGNHGTLENFSDPQTPTSGWVTGKRGSALAFAGVSSDDSVNVGDINATDGVAALTVSMWIYDRNPGTGKGILSKFAGATPGWVFYTSDVGDGGSDDVSFAPNGSDRAYTTGNVHQANRWEHWVAVFSGGGGTVTLYLNGVEQTIVEGGLIPAATNSTANVIRIGADSDLGAEFEGIIDEVRIYNRALAQSEITALSRSGAIRLAANSTTLTSGTTLGISGGLIGHWTFDGGDFDGAIYDRSSSGNNGSVAGGVSTTSVKVIGKLGQGFNFDGTAGYALLGNASTYNFSSGAFSTAFWFKAPVLEAGDHFISRESLLSSGWAIGTEDGSTITFYTNQSASQTTDTGAVNVDNGQWHHIVTTYSNGTLTLYIDGVLDSALNSVTPAASLPTRNMYLGVDDTRTDFAAMVMDDVRIYNRVLTAAEAKQLYNLGKATINP